MNDHDIDAMNDRALESLDRLHALGRYEAPPLVTMHEPLDEDEALIRASYAAVLGVTAFPKLTAATQGEPSLLDDRLVSYRVSDGEALLNANQHDLQRDLK